MKAELFKVFTEKQIQAIKDCIRFGHWGDTTHMFKGDEQPTPVDGFCTSDIDRGRHFNSKQISGVCSGISRRIRDNNLNWIGYEADAWGDNSGGMIYIHYERLDTTLEELIEWSKK